MSSAGGFGPGKLWSLWDIMRELHLPSLLSLMAALEALGTENIGDWKKIKPATKENISKYFPQYKDVCRDIGLVASLASVEKLIKAGAAPNAKWADVTRLCHELRDRLIDETQGRAFFGLNARETDFFVNSRKTWETAIARFPSIVDDVEEANKCYALQRYAASVFHSTQIVEAGLIELGTFLEIADPKSGWTAVSKALNSVVQKSHNTRTAFERRNFAFLEQVQATVEVLKNAWRNKISHAHGRLVLMTADFNPEIAEEILLASRAFIRRLADGLPPTEKERA